MDTQSAAYHSRDIALKGFAWFISILVIAILIIHSLALFFGQVAANKMVIETGDAIQSAISGSSGSPADFTAAIQYIEAAQNAYSADTSAKFLSLVYTILTTAVLGWGSKMLLIGAEDRKELLDKISMETEAQSKQISEDRKELLDKISKETETQFKQISIEIENKLFLQSAIFAATTSCRNAAHTCLLLQNYIRFADQAGSAEDQAIPEFIDNLQVDLLHSLERFRDFLVDCTEGKEKYAMTEDQKKLIVGIWETSSYSISSYIHEGTTPMDSPLYKLFGQGDYDIVDGLHKEISAEIKKISDSDA